MRPLLVLILLGACATTGAPPLAAAPAPAARSGATHAELLARGEARFAERLDLAQLDAAIAAWREAAALAPDDPVAWARLARALHFRAEGHLVFAVATDRGARDAYRAALDESAGAAERALAALSPELARLRRLGVPLSEAAAVLDARAALPLYWWAQSTLLAAHSRGLGATVGVHAEVFAVMERVAALAPDTWYGGPDRYFGVVFAAAPAIAGGATWGRRARTSTPA
jgi:tetratricopeptide (TPR) repeat protein